MNACMPNTASSAVALQLTSADAYVYGSPADWRSERLLCSCLPQLGFAERQFHLLMSIKLFIGTACEYDVR